MLEEQPYTTVNNGKQQLFKMLSISCHTWSWNLKCWKVGI